MAAAEKLPEAVALDYSQRLARIESQLETLVQVLTRPIPDPALAAKGRTPSALEYSAQAERGRIARAAKNAGVSIEKWVKKHGNRTHFLRPGER